MPCTVIFNGNSVDNSNKEALKLHQVFLDLTTEGKNPDIVKDQLLKVAKKKNIRLGEPMVRPVRYYSHTGYRRGNQ